MSPQTRSSTNNTTTADPHQGGSLSDMAATGTSIPNDAGIQRTIPSVPRPDQISESNQFNNQGLAEPTTAFAADNDASMPRGPGDLGHTGEVLTGTGNSLPASGEDKRGNVGVGYPGGNV
ncbi:hypothetical protein P170DRAFT_483505 [Aspergillus steynii IBT 23096]|uniref:Uncharacterized protein n=1 Tax=Aspergillus steynii IBT 23096 TaxID=1392250 RepID=A0A2I2GPI1_9EURO|nr:uncharacterized protein P170DRAFT_483505 [Aspergillus steynii IBT 23096]PLB54782.1 hypothetical protein P170DRAFT_483505 [Aspergillus steynii IBT 23096]